jgi:hypothetical protein
MLVPLDGEAGLAGTAAAPVDLPDERAILRREGENVAHAGGDDDGVDDAYGNRLAVARRAGRKVGERPLPKDAAAAGLEQPAWPTATSAMLRSEEVWRSGKLVVPLRKEDENKSDAADEAECCVLTVPGLRLPHLEPLAADDHEAEEP